MKTVETKLCTDRKVTTVHKALTYLDGDSTFEYFTECLKEKCVAYNNGYCKKYNSGVDYIIEKE